MTQLFSNPLQHRIDRLEGRHFESTDAVCMPALNLPDTFQLVRIDGLRRPSVDKVDHHQTMQAYARLLTGIHAVGGSWIYLVHGNRDGITVYLGLPTRQVLSDEWASLLTSALGGCVLTDMPSVRSVLDPIRAMKATAIVTGNPSIPHDTGETDDGKVQITEGLDAGDQVVISGKINLRDSTPVEIIKQ